MMRLSALVALLLSTLLAACATDKDALANKNISQQGALKVHPGLLGQPVPLELQPTPSPAVTAPAAKDETAAAPAEPTSVEQPAADSR
jgi:peptidoglycan-associated lipoprotein